MASAQYFFLLALIYGGYAVDRRKLGMSGAEDTIQSLTSMGQAILLGSFAMLLTAHRTEIMDRNSNLHSTPSVDSNGFREVDDESLYDPPTPSFG